MNSVDQVFISYAHEDLDRAREIYRGLQERGLSVWFDKEDLRPGRWKAQIEKAIARSRYFIILLSEIALRKTGDEPGFQDEKLNRAYNIAQEQPRDSFAIIPVRLEECGRGDHRVTAFQQFDLFADWDSTLDRLAVQLGGNSLVHAQLSDDRSELEKAFGEFRNRAIASYYAGDHEGALAVWESVAVLYGDGFDTWFWRGMNLDALERHEQALAAYKNALKNRPDSLSALNNIGVVFTKLESHGQALESFDSLLSREPRYALGWFNKAITLASLERYGEARDSLLQVRAIDPEYIGRHESSWGRFMEVMSRTDGFSRFDDDDFPFGGPVAA